MDIEERVIRKLRNAIYQRGLSIKDVSVRMNVPAKYLYRTLSGERKITLTDFVNILVAIGVPAESVLPTKVLRQPESIEKGESV